MAHGQQNNHTLNLSNRYSQLEQNFQTTESIGGVQNQVQMVTQEHSSQLDESEEKVQIAASEFDLLQSCQKIIDAALSMKCIKCEQVFATTDFYDHIIVQRECVLDSDAASHSHHLPRPTDGLNIMDSHYFDELNEKHSNVVDEERDTHLEALDQSRGNLMKSSLLNSMEECDRFYDALNMPL